MLLFLGDFGMLKDRVNIFIVFDVQTKSLTGIFFLALEHTIVMSAVSSSFISISKEQLDFLFPLPKSASNDKSLKIKELV